MPLASSPRIAAVAAMVLHARAAPPGAAAAADPLEPSIRRGVLGSRLIKDGRSDPMLDQRRTRPVFGPDGQLPWRRSDDSMRCQFTLDSDKRHIGPASTTQRARAPMQLERENRDLTTLAFVVTARVRPDGWLALLDAEGRGELRAVRLPATA